MPKVQQTFENHTEQPIYISIEFNPECYQLKPGDRLTMIFDLPENSDAPEVHFLNEKELVIWPNENSGEPEMLINGKSAEGLSWNFSREP